MADTHVVTRLLRLWAEGDSAARDELIPLVYGELRKIAARYLRVERPDHSLQPTALVHEAYLRLVDTSSPHFAANAWDARGRSRRRLAWRINDPRSC